jgi:putative ABC transport system substrate-binding protein
VRRREALGTLAALGVAATPLLARAQQPRKIPTVGALFPNPSRGPGWGKFDTALDLYASYLSELGWKVGQNVTIEIASTEGREDRLPELAAALVEKKVDVIWVAGPEAAVAAARATQAIPIVFYGVGVPVEQGLVNSLARPGRNVTGIASLAGNEVEKRLELLRDIAPDRRRLAWVAAETVALHVSGGKVSAALRDVISTGQRLGFEVRRYPVSKREDFDAVFAAVSASDAQSLYCDFTALTIRERHRIVEFANGRRLASAYGALPYVEAGGLLSYGANRSWMVKYSWTFVDRILRGARAAEVPIELPTRFDLAVNLRTAKALGLAVPPVVLLRADRVIE